VAVFFNIVNKTQIARHFKLTISPTLPGAELSCMGRVDLGRLHFWPRWPVVEFITGPNSLKKQFRTITKNFWLYVTGLFYRWW